MNELYLILFVLVLAVIVYLTLRSSSTDNGNSEPKMVVGLFLPEEGNNSGISNSLKLGIEDTGATVSLIEDTFKDDDALGQLIQNFETQYQQNRRVIVAGRTTNQILRAQEVLDRLGSNTLAISLASAAPFIFN